MKFKPHIVVDKAEIVLKMPYNAAAKEALKERIPRSQRRWDGEAKAWRMTANQEIYDFLRQLIIDYFGIEPPTFTVGGDVSATLETAIDTTTYYTILGVEPTATEAEIKKAHRRLILQIHPDKGGLSRHFILVQKAYETLSNPIKRRRYDAALRLSQNGVLTQARYRGSR